MSKKSSPKTLPRIKKAELKKTAKFEEKNSRASQNHEGTMWIIAFAFAMLAVFGLIVWAVFINRPEPAPTEIPNRSTDEVKIIPTEETEDDKE